MSPGRETHANPGFRVREYRSLVRSVDACGRKRSIIEPFNPDPGPKSVSQKPPEIQCR